MYVYCIENRDGHLYVGITGSLVQRLRQHKAGKTRSTNKGDLNWELMWFWNCDDYISASKWERLLHKCSKTGIIQYICEHPTFDEWIQKRIALMPTTDFEKMTSNQRNWIMEGRGDPLEYGIK
jgi:predicted GIY-YIG superfamily endonuclease